MVKYNRFLNDIWLFLNRGIWKGNKSTLCVDRKNIHSLSLTVPKLNITWLVTLKPNNIWTINIKSQYNNSFQQILVAASLRTEMQLWLDWFVALIEHYVTCHVNEQMSLLRWFSLNTTHIIMWCKHLLLENDVFLMLIF